METIYLERHLVTLPLLLDPTAILTNLRGQSTTVQARFKTNVIATFHPNVPATTPGEVILAVTGNPTTEARELVNAQPSIVTPVWRKRTLNIPKSLVNRETWQRRADGAIWLCSNAESGSVTITCTIQSCIITNGQNLEETVPEPPSLVKTLAVVGPRLAGFSLCYYGTVYPQNSSTGGQVINIDLQNSRGWTTSARYVRTPESKPYVVVRYGWYTFRYVYNSANTPFKGWYNNADIIQTYDDTTNSNPGDRPNFWASWAKIRGSTSWWCETKPDEYNPSAGTYTPLYKPYSVLFLYYDYGDVDIFSSDFMVSPIITPRICQPTPGPDFKPGGNYKLTLNGYNPFLLASHKWQPTLRTQDLDLKATMQAWPCDRGGKSSQQHIVPSPDHTKED